MISETLWPCEGRGKEDAIAFGRGPPTSLAKRRDLIPSDQFPPYWRDVLDEMRKA